jgi:hypothetical protein
MTLESHYRLLLGTYPREHQQAYGQEMLGVLMEGSRPGQRFPALADVADLLWSGLTARFGRGVNGLNKPVWRDAAAVAALLVSTLLAGVAGRRLVFGLQAHWVAADPIGEFGVSGLRMFDVVLRAAAWLAVLAAVAFGARRTALGLAVFAALVEVVAMAVWLPDQNFRAFRMAWVPEVALLVVALLSLARSGRPAGSSVGRRGVLLIVAAVLAGVLSPLYLAWLPGLMWVSYAIGTMPVTVGLLVLVALPLLLVALWPVKPKVRRRAIVLLVPAAALPIAQQVMWNVFQMTAALQVTPAMIAAESATLIAVPLLALAAGRSVVAVHERRVKA